MKLPVKHTECRYCRGTGKEIDAKALGLALRKKREERGLPMTEIARLLSISPSHVNDVEKGNRVPSKTVLEGWLRLL